MTEIKQLPIKQVAHKLKDLFEAHWNEVYGDTTSRKANINLPLYEQLEEAGAAFALWAFYDDIEIGYSVNFLAPNLHSAGGVSCNNDCLYVDPLFRDTSLGLRLIKETEKLAKKKGADLMIWNAPLNTNLGLILPRFNYTALEKVFVKEI